MAEDLDEIPPLEDIPNLNITKPSEIKQPTIVNRLVEVENEEQTTTQTKQESSSFGGFKKGFLASGKTTSKKSDEMIYVKSNPATKTDLKINHDIKNVLKETYVEPSKAWLTDDLLEQIDKNNILKKGFLNQRLLDKVTKFQKNPQAAIKECENDPEAQLFLKEFLKIMGNHLTTNKFDIKTTELNANEIKKVEIEDPEQRKANELINNPEVRELLMDSGVQNLFMLLRNNPENSQKILSNANREMQVKIQKLISYGLLSTR